MAPRGAAAPEREAEQQHGGPGKDGAEAPPDGAKERAPGRGAALDEEVLRPQDHCAASSPARRAAAASVAA